MDLSASAYQLLQWPYVWDALLLLGVAYGVWSGWRRGLVREGSALIGLLAALILAVWQSPIYAPTLVSAGVAPGEAHFLTFVAIFGGVTVGCLSLLHGMHLATSPGMGAALDRAAGSALGTLKGVVAVMGTAMAMQYMVAASGYSNSVTGWVGSIEPLLLSLPQRLHL